MLISLELAVVEIFSGKQPNIIEFPLDLKKEQVFDASFSAPQK